MSTPVITPQADPQQQQTIAQRVRAKFPGAYDDLDDYTLEQKVLAKYPAYSDLPQTPKPQPNAGLAPPAGPRINMQTSGLAPTYDAGQRAAGVAGMPGASPNLVSAGPGYTAAVGIPAGIAAGVMGGSSALPFLSRFAAQHPLVATMLGSEAISQARKLPGVGRFVPPYAEWLPFLLGGKGKAAEVEGGAPIERDATRQNVPFAGEESAEAPPTRAPAPTPKAQPQADSTAAQLPWMPTRATTQWPRSGSPEDIQETREIQEQARDTAESENQALLRLGNQERYAGPTKGELTGSENAPVKLTKTPSASTKPKVKTSAPAKAPYYLTGGARPVSGSAPPAEGSEDLTPQLQQSLVFLKNRKGQQ